ncbi:putative 37S ribosomal protein S18 [Colletotrichum sidae]|uniref:Putative 37S ribosomal protein S18 n=1 Tax=Colletotrichum sidae TaxID=1347389 RepID=A0A4R8T6Q4_9PEZI|nr:putative 37S ribosomal protein S18 [Colletotrichum sidae]
MTSAPTARLLARSVFQHAARPVTVARCSPILNRPFSQTTTKRDGDAPEPKKAGQELLAAMYGTTNRTSSTPRTSDTPRAGRQQSMLLRTLGRVSGQGNIFKKQDTASPSSSSLDELVPEQEDDLEPYHMHIYSHKHNTHVTITKPDRGAIISLSTGNIGFKKSKRKSYDAAYQLTAYVFERLNYAGWHKKINKLEVVLKGFGAGRDAAVKVLMAPEGKLWRSKVVRVADATTLKFGGTRSPNPRRV